MAKVMRGRLWLIMVGFLLLLGLNGGMAQMVFEPPDEDDSDAQVQAAPEVPNTPLTPEAEKRIKELIPQLGSDDFPTRESATDELIKMGKMVIPFAIDLLKETDPEVKMRAAKILNATGGWVKVPALAEDRITNLLGEVDTRNFQADSMVWSLGFSGELSLYQVQSITQKIYRTLKPAGADVVPALVKNLEKAADVNRKIILLYLLGKFPAKESGPAVAKLLADDNAPVKYLALDTLGKIKNEDSIPAIIKAAQESDKNVRMLAYAALSNFRSPDALDYLVKGLSDKNANIRCSAFYGLWNVNHHNSLGYNPFDSAARRNTAVAAWQKWVAESAGKPIAASPRRIVAYYCLRDFQKIKDSFLQLPVWTEEKDLKVGAAKLYEEGLGQITQVTKIPSAVLAQVIDSLSSIDAAYYGQMKLEIKGADDKFTKHSIPIILAQINVVKPAQLAELFNGPLKPLVMLKEQYQDKEILCLNPGIWAYLNDTGLAVCPDKEILKGAMDAGGLVKQLEAEPDYRETRDRLAADYCLWSYAHLADMMNVLIGDEQSVRGMGFKIYQQISSALDLSGIKFGGCGYTIKDNHFRGTSFVKVDPDQAIYKIVRSAPAKQSDLLNVISADSFITMSWSFTKDPAQIWQEGFKYVMSRLKEASEGEFMPGEEEISKQLTDGLGMKPEECFGLFKDGAAINLIKIDVKRGDEPLVYVVLPVKDLEKTQEAVKKWGHGSFAKFTEKEYKGIKYFLDEQHREGGYTFIDNKLIIFPPFGKPTDVAKSVIDIYKGGQTLDKLLAGAQKEGLFPEVANSSLVLALNMGKIGEMLKGKDKDVYNSLGFNKNSLVISSLMLDKPDEITSFFWSNIPISDLLSKGIKLGLTELGGLPVKPGAGNDDMDDLLKRLKDQEQKK